MKVKLDIDQQYTEEQIIIEAPTLSPRVQKVQDFVQNLEQKETLKGKFQDQVYLIQISKIQRVYIENRKVLAETDSQTYTLDIRLYQASEILPASFIQIYPFHCCYRSQRQRTDSIDLQIRSGQCSY